MDIKGLEEIKNDDLPIVFSKLTIEFKVPFAPVLVHKAHRLSSRNNKSKLHNSLIVQFVSDSWLEVGYRRRDVLSRDIQGNSTSSLHV